MDLHKSILVKEVLEVLLGLRQQIKNCRQEMGLLVESFKGGIYLFHRPYTALICQSVK